MLINLLLAKQMFLELLLSFITVLEFNMDIIWATIARHIFISTNYFCNMVMY